MTELVGAAINAVLSAKAGYCKFISANDVGATGGHQCGYLIGTTAWPLLFSEPGKKGQNLTKPIFIEWYGYGTTESAAKWYGVKTRREYRITRFGKGFPFLGSENTGDLLVIARTEADHYQGYILSSEEEIEDFLSAFNLDVTQTNRLIYSSVTLAPDQGLFKEGLLIDEAISHFGDEFPPSRIVSEVARNIVAKVRKTDGLLQADKALFDWIEVEYRLFKAVEDRYHMDDLAGPFAKVDALVALAGQIMNRRKARAGRSLENHLDALLTMAGLSFDHPGRTEGHSEPDFLLPSGKYFDIGWPSDRLVMLAAKTTCKDRWRQILPEADKIKTKHLCTLQQGISANQMDEMERAGVVLVVPSEYHRHYPADRRGRLLSVGQFIDFARETTGFSLGHQPGHCLP